MLNSGLLAALGRVGAALGGGEPVVVSDRSGGVVVRAGEVVLKAHPAGADPAALLARLRLAADPALAAVMVPPLRIPDGLAAADLDGWAACADGRLVTAWPAGEPVPAHDPDAAPWEDAAVLLARLHAVPIGDRDLPAAGGAARLVGAMARLREFASGAEVADVERAYAVLPPWVSDRALAPTRHDALIHGDWHFGQLIRRAAGVEAWRLVDVDDLGVGDPVWDLARPAALFAAGLLDPDAWHRFLTAYQRAGGPALPPGADPWTVLDVPARALVVQLAATGLAVTAGPATGTGLGAERDDDEDVAALVASCRRMVDGMVGDTDVS